MKLKKREDRKLRATKTQIKTILTLVGAVQKTIEKRDDANRFAGWERERLAFRVTRMLIQSGELPNAGHIAEVFDQLDTVEECMREVKDPLIEDSRNTPSAVRNQALNILAMAGSLDGEDEQ